MRNSTICKISFVVAMLDLACAVLFAAHGDIRFAGFMVLAGLMWAQGLYFQAKEEDD